jgi:hypothetical protein
LVVPADLDALDVVESDGPARVPDLDTAGAHFGRIHALGLRRRRTPGHPLRYDVLLLPFQSTPPDAVRLRRAGDTVRIETPTITDTLTDTRWERTDLTTSRVLCTRIGDSNG